MSQPDSIMDDAERNIVASIRLVEQIGEALRARRTLKLQVSQQEMYAEQARLNQELSVARPYLAEGMRDAFWRGAEAEDMSRMLGVATRFRDVDPLAGQVYSRALREIEDRYGTRALEVEQVSIDELSDEEVDQVIPQVPGEDIPVSDVREGREAEKEPVPQWVQAWAEDMRKGQAKAADYYQDLFSAGEVASAQGEANRAHLEADHARADLADAEKGQESEVASPEVDQAKSQVLSAEERERLTQVRRDQIGTEAAKAVELKEVSFPEPAEEAITKAKPTTKVGKAKVARKQAGRAR
ncbi:hypothetical protein [Trueperella bernardiae]|uniref:hypothetical protein n=1 Tax=Trueperella bernardiae TaxID=59561 RepID=UPI00204475D6|nr:hypothetical protein [Trueperella bernardiae]MCM3908072.1 hypothetical protein [Trueperella bernardiae]